MNAGLWMDRLLPAEAADQPDIKSLHIGALEHTMLSRGYDRALGRRDRAFRALGAARFDVRVSGKIVAGLGFRGVLEAGLALDHTWGTPVIPGSSLKGGLRPGWRRFAARLGRDGAALLPG